MAENFPNLKKETDIQIQKVPKQDEHNQIYTNMYYNKKKRHKLKGEDSKGRKRKKFFFNKQFP